MDRILVRCKMHRVREIKMCFLLLENLILLIYRGRRTPLSGDNGDVHFLSCSSTQHNPKQQRGRLLTFVTIYVLYCVFLDAHLHIS